MKTRIVLATFVAAPVGVAAILSFNHRAPVRSPQDIATIKELPERIKHLEHEQALGAKANATAQIDYAKLSQKIRHLEHELAAKENAIVGLSQVGTGTLL